MLNVVLCNILNGACLGVDQICCRPAYAFNIKVTCKCCILVWATTFVVAAVVVVVAVVVAVVSGEALFLVQHTQEYIQNILVFRMALE